MAETEYHVDSNHLGVRIAVLITMLGGFIGGIVGIPALLRLLGIASGLNILLVVGGAFGLAFGLSWLVEVVLRKVWPSGRSLGVKTDQIILREKDGENVTLAWNAIDMWSWCFAVDDRRQWVPRGWYCCALRLTEGGQAISPYSFFKPSDAQALPGWEAFQELISEKFAKRPGNEHLAAMVTDQTHLRAAEDERWQQGVEMKADDFVALLDEVQKRTGWPDKAV